MHYHVGNNMPGYLPTSDEPPHTFDTWEDARFDLRTELTAQAYYEDNTDKEIEYMSALQQVTAWIPDLAGDCTSVMAAGRVWWIQRCTKTECENDNA